MVVRWLLEGWPSGRLYCALGAWRAEAPGTQNVCSLGEHHNHHTPRVRPESTKRKTSGQENYRHFHVVVLGYRVW